MSHLIDKDGQDQSKAIRKGKKLSIEETANILGKLQDPNDPLGQLKKGMLMSTYR